MDALIRLAPARALARRFGLLLIATAPWVASCLAGGAEAPVRELEHWPVPETMQLTPEENRRAEALARFATGLSLELQRDVDGAIEQYRQALQLDPANTNLAIRVAGIYLSRKEYAPAAELLEAASKANPTSADAVFWLGVAYRSAEQPAKAIAALRQTLKLRPTHLDAVATLLEMFAEQSATADIVKLLDQAWRQNSADPVYWAKLGDLIGVTVKRTPSLAAKIDNGRIQQCYEKAVNLAPDDPDLLLRLAAVFEAQSDNKKAAEFLEKVVALNPNKVAIRMRLAQYYVAADQKVKAAAELEEVMKREPQNFQIHNFLGEIYEDLDQADKAISDYQQSLILKPDQLAPYLRITLLQLKLKKNDDAFQTLATAKEKFPADYQVPYFHGLAYSDIKQYDKAVTAFVEAETLAKDAPGDVKLGSPFYFSYGAALERQGEFDKATTLFRKAIELDPKNDNAYNYLGYMWADKGINLEEAHQFIKKALEIEPDNGAYLDSLGWVLFKLGRVEDALPPLRRAVELLKDEDAVVYEHIAEVPIGVSVLLSLGRGGQA